MKMCIVGMDHNLQSGPPNVIFVGLEPHLTIVVTTINPTAIVNQLGGINIASNFGSRSTGTFTTGVVLRMRDNLKGPHYRW